MDPHPVSADQINLTTAGNIETEPKRVALVTIQPGEDVGLQILAQLPESSQVGHISTAFGFVQNPTLESLSRTITHVGCFAITSLHCSYERDDNNQITVTGNGMRMAIANSEFEVYSGRVIGPLIAAAPTQVVLLHSPHLGDF